MPINVLAQDDFRPMTADEAARRFAGKAALPSDEFDELSAAMKARAFRIATVNNARLVQHARTLLTRAIREGTSFAEFRRELLALFDTAGIPRPALGRLRLAFKQNTMQAYSDARRDTLDKPEVTRAFPYRRYMTVGNGTPGVRNVRAEHAVLHGKIFAWDDAFWNHFTPPWDYGCRCTFIALTAGQVKRRRATVWTYTGGGIRPAPAKRQLVIGRRFGMPRIPLKPKPGFGGKQTEIDFDLSELDADLRRIVEEQLR